MISNHTWRLGCLILETRGFPDPLYSGGGAYKWINLNYFSHWKMCFFTTFGFKSQFEILDKCDNLATISCIYCIIFREKEKTEQVVRIH